MEIILYRNKSAPNVVDKDSYLIEVDTIEGTFRNETSLTDVTLTIEYNQPPRFNYVYITGIGKYYFVSNIVSIRNNLWELQLEEDVLMTYKDQILNCYCFVDRNEQFYCPYTIDNERVIREGSYIEQVLHLTTPSTFPNIQINDIEGETYPSEFCVVLNGYKFSAVDLT